MNQTTQVQIQLQLQMQQVANDHQVETYQIDKRRKQSQHPAIKKTHKNRINH